MRPGWIRQYTISNKAIYRFPADLDDFRVGGVHPGYISCLLVSRENFLLRLLFVVFRSFLRQMEDVFVMGQSERILELDRNAGFFFHRRMIPIGADRSIPASPSSPPSSGSRDSAMSERRPNIPSSSSPSTSHDSVVNGRMSFSPYSSSSSSYSSPVRFSACRRCFTHRCG